jgi:hypothetical protein
LEGRFIKALLSFARVLVENMQAVLPADKAQCRAVIFEPSEKNSEIFLNSAFLSKSRR